MNLWTRARVKLGSLLRLETVLWRHPLGLQAKITLLVTLIVVSVLVLFSYLDLFSFWKRKREVFIRIANRTKERYMEKMRYLTRRTRSGKLEDILWEVNQYNRGWMAYYRLATTPSVYQELDEWLRRRLRQLLWKRWKHGATRLRELVRLGVPAERARLGATGTSPWRMAHCPPIHEALNNAFWRNSGLESLSVRYNQLRYSR